MSFLSRLFGKKETAGPEKNEPEEKIKPPERPEIKEEIEPEEKIEPPERPEIKENPYLDNEDLWANWRKRGITEATLLIVDFAFISESKRDARGLAEFFQRSGYTANFEEYPDHEKSSKEKMMWQVHLALPRQTWTLGKLNQQARELQLTAKNYSCTIDGIGAMMPQK
jgi:hypothetical protein